MAGVSTGVSLLSVNNTQPRLLVWHDFNVGSTYPNSVDTGQFITNTTGYQQNSSPVSGALGSYHLDNKDYSGSTSYNLHPYNTPYPKITTPDFSVTYWVNTAQAPSTTSAMSLLVCNEGSLQFAIAHDGYRVRITVNGTTRVTYDLTSGIWNNVTVTMKHNGSSSYELELYVNNVNVGFNSFSASAFTGLDIVTFMSYFAGTTSLRSPRYSIDSLGVYQFQLSPAQVSTLYNSGNGRTYSDTIK